VLPTCSAFHVCRLRDDSHENEAVLGYLAAENTYSNAVLKQVQPLQEQLLAEMESRLVAEADPVPVRHGNWWYYDRHDSSGRFAVQYRRPAMVSQQHRDAPAPGTAADVQQGAVDDSNLMHSQAASFLREEDEGPDLDAQEQVVLDPNVACARHAAGAEACEVVGQQVSPDGQLLAYGLDATGNEAYTLVVKRLSDDAVLPDTEIENTSGDYEWSADSRSLFYITRDEITSRPCRVWYYKVGDDPATAQLLWAEQDAAFYLSLSRTTSGRFLVLSAASEVRQGSTGKYGLV
jgi:oligopeptidase B